MLREHSSSRKVFSAIFVYVSTAGTVYTEQKQKKWGREKISNSPACWRLAGQKKLMQAVVSLVKYL